MVFILVFFLLFCLISFMIMAIAAFLGFNQILNKEKLSPFECGFDPYLIARSPFSLKFFLVTIIFLIFDVEIIVLFPLGLSFTYHYYAFLTFSAVLITLILSVGLIHEWNFGALNWAI